jgi:hypothetical protein
MIATNSPQDSRQDNPQSVLHWTAKRAEDIGMNIKQIELAEDVLKTLTVSYPQVKHLGYSRDPADKQIVWIIVEAPIADEAEEERFRHLGNDLTNEITNAYGYDFFVMSYNSLLNIPLYGSLQAA